MKPICQWPPIIPSARLNAKDSEGVRGVDVHRPAHLAGLFSLLQLPDECSQGMLEAATVARLQQQLGPEAAGTPFHGGRDRAPDLEPVADQLLDALPDPFKKFLRQCQPGGIGADQRDVAARRQPCSTALGQCDTGKRRVALVDQLLQQRVVRVMGLDDDLAGAVMAACPV